VFGLVFERGAVGLGVKNQPQMSKVYSALLVVVALTTMAAVGTLASVVVTDVGYLA
jgi:hypothetical protein